MFQGTLLLFLLAADVFIHYRLRIVRTPAVDRATRVALMDTVAQLVLLTLAAGTPLVFAALGELVTEKSGVLNLGVEGHDARRRRRRVHRRRDDQVAVARRGRAACARAPRSRCSSRS